MNDSPPQPPALPDPVPELFLPPAPRHKRRAKATSPPAAGRSGTGPEAVDSPEELPDELVLDQLGKSAAYCQQVEEQLAKFITPELETIMKLHRIIVLKLTSRADVRPEHWDVVKDLMKPVMDWARLQEQRKEREFAEQKHRDQMAAEQAEQAASDQKPEDQALSPETIEKIEFELKLL